MGSPNTSKDPQISSPPRCRTPSSLLGSFLLLQRPRNPGSRPFMTQASRLGRAGSWIRNAVISRPLPAPLPGGPPPRAPTPLPVCLPLGWDSGNRKPGSLSGRRRQYPAQTPGSAVWLRSQNGGGTSPQELLLPRSAPIYGRARVGEPRLPEQDLGENALRSGFT